MAADPPREDVLIGQRLGIGELALRTSAPTRRRVMQPPELAAVSTAATMTLLREAGQRA
jgi:hypothetical protein